MLGQRRVRSDRLVTREHTATEKAVAGRIGRKLVVAVEVSVADTLLEPIDDARCFTELHHAPDLDARTQPQFDPGDDPEQSVAADRQPEQVWMRVPRACAQLTVWPQQVERVDLLDDRFQIQSTSVRIARQRTGQAQSIRASLLLVD